MDLLHILYGIIIGIIITHIIVNIKTNCFISNDTYKLQSTNIKLLLRQCARWAIAAKQDTNIMIGVLHANYAAGYLWALKDIATDTQIEQATGINIKKFTQEIISIQDKTTKQMIDIAPKFGPEKSNLSLLGKINI
tara:strand:- start:12 stop:419 length:408 start_codon:yes stop_codon:yes gene_type:complete